MGLITREQAIDALFEDVYNHTNDYPTYDNENIIDTFEDKLMLALEYVVDLQILLKAKENNAAKLLKVDTQTKGVLNMLRVEYEYGSKEFKTSIEEMLQHMKKQNIS